jgi:hypothetical protein
MYFPFEAFYGRKCNTVVSWDNPTNNGYWARFVERNGSANEKDQGEFKGRQKSYADKNKVFRDFKEGEHVFLKVKAKRSSLGLGRCPKLAARYCGPFEILEKIS